MVLKKVIFSSIILLCTASIFSQQKDFWKDLMNTAFSNSLKVGEIEKEYSSALINKKEYDYQWFPQLQMALQNTFNGTRGDGLYVLNSEPNSEFTWITSPFTSFSISQKLPAYGSLSLSAGYGFNYSFDRKAFLQYPQIQFSINQYLLRSGLGKGNNVEYNLVKEQMNYYSLIYRKDLNAEIQNVLALLEKTDTLCAQEAYYKALVTEYESELETSKEKNLSGLQSNLQLHYANHKLSEAQDNLNDTIFEKENTLKELYILIPTINIETFQNHRNELKQIIGTLYEKIEPASQKIKKNFDSKIYENILQQYLYQYKNNEVNYAPEFYVTSSVSPNSSLTSYYSDWYKSLRIFKENKNPFDFSVSVGIRTRFELPQAYKLRKEIIF